MGWGFVLIGELMDKFKTSRYEQAYEDWRHRDQLTWQIPSVLVIVGGVLVSEAYESRSPNLSFVRIALLLFAFGLSIALTIALCQNLYLQSKDRETVETIDPVTKTEKRLTFFRVGSFSLLFLSIAISGFLGWLCWREGKTSMMEVFCSPWADLVQALLGVSGAILAMFTLKTHRERQGAFDTGTPHPVSKPRFWTAVILIVLVALFPLVRAFIGGCNSI